MPTYTHITVDHSYQDKVATMNFVMEDKESEEALAQMALEEREGEVEAIEEDLEMVEKAAKKAKRAAAKK